MLRCLALDDIWIRFTGLAFGFMLSAITLTGCGRKQNEESFRSETATPRTWRSEQHGFEVTIPSERWKERENSNVLAFFGTSDFTATVAEARPAQSESEWLAALNFAQSMRVGPGMREDKPTANVEEKNGPNPNGHEFWLYVADVQAGSKSYFLGVSITRVRGKAVIMMFEGKPQSDSHNAATQRSQAIQFLSSVK